MPLADFLLVAAGLSLSDRRRLSAARRTRCRKASAATEDTAVLCISTGCAGCLGEAEIPSPQAPTAENLLYTLDYHSAGIELRQSADNLANPLVILPGPFTN
jgi:hypothetical protein